MESTIQITHILLGQLAPSPMNPRKHFDQESLQELADSITEKGVLQPILVRPICKDDYIRYEIVAGERRYRASIMTSNTTIPAIIRELNDEEALEIQIIENLQRQDIHPMEEAVGFQQLSNIKHMAVKEIALRVGKSPSYVAHRMKLNTLIDEIQKFFYDGLLHLKDAISLTTLSPDDQFQFYSEQLKDETGIYIMNKYQLNRYRHRLKNAPFDISDPEILPRMGACVSCQFNSGYEGVLFPELALDPVCGKKECFQEKCNLSFTRELVKAQEDPAVVLITGEYNASNETRKLMQKIEGILTYDQIETVYQPEYPDRSEFDGENETSEEDDAEYKAAIEDYEIENKKFLSKIQSGGYVKAYQVGGDEKGKYTFIKLRKSSGKVASKSTSSKKGTTPSETVADIKAEITRLRTREDRSKELDAVKEWAEIVKLFNPAENIRDLHGDFSTKEATAIAYAIFNKLSWQRKEEFEKLFTGKVRKSKYGSRADDLHFIINADSIKQMLRFFFLDTLPPQAIYGDYTQEAAIMKEVAEEYWPNAVESICIDQKQRAEKRSKRVDDRIKDLQAKLKAEKPKAATSKKTSRKKAPVV